MSARPLRRDYRNKTSSQECAPILLPQHSGQLSSGFQVWKIYLTSCENARKKTNTIFYIANSGFTLYSFGYTFLWRTTSNTSFTWLWLRYSFLSVITLLWWLSLSPYSIISEANKQTFYKTLWNVILKKEFWKCYRMKKAIKSWWNQNEISEVTHLEYNKQ